MLILKAAEFGNSAEQGAFVSLNKSLTFGHLRASSYGTLLIAILCSIIKDYNSKHSGISGRNRKCKMQISYLCSVKRNPLREPLELIV